jgi:hypothetical protein
MEDEIDIVPRAVGEVIWKYFHIINSSASTVYISDQPLLARGGA